LNRYAYAPEVLLVRLDASLRCYPVSLSGAFGADMSEAFRQQTLDAWEEGGWFMLLPVLIRAIAELFTEALPARAGSREAIAGAGSLVCTSAVFWGLLWALRNPLAVKALGDRLPRLLWGG
jgi:hypothetical protein